jgi:hypothetical protein
MTRQVAATDLLRDYIAGVMDRADHHAAGVNEIVLALAGALVWRKDKDPVEVTVRDGDMKNVLWFRAGGTRYALSYNPRSGAMELRESGTQGQLMGSFTNSTPCSEVRRIFEQL